MSSYIKNIEKRGIEIYFDDKPDDASLVALKLAKWRWHPAKGCWYNQDSTENEKFAQQVCSAITKPASLDTKLTDKKAFTTTHLTKKQQAMLGHIIGAAQEPPPQEIVSPLYKSIQSDSSIPDAEITETSRAGTHQSISHNAKTSKPPQSATGGWQPSADKQMSNIKEQNRLTQRLKEQQLEAEKEIAEQKRLAQQLEDQMKIEQALAQQRVEARKLVAQRLEEQKLAEQKWQEEQRLADQRLAEAMRTPIPNQHIYSDKIVLSENVTTLEGARDLLVHHYNNKQVFGEDILGLVTHLDSYTHSSRVAAEVIAKLFPPPQMAYDKFMGELSDSNATFLRIICKGADIIGVATKRSPKRDEILGRIKADAHSLAELCDDLTTVLINKYGDENDDDESAREIDVLLSDLQMLIESVKNYS